MADSPDMNDLARRYMDLWQAHLNAVAGDRETADVLAQTMALMSSGAQAFAASARAAAEGAPDDATTPGTTTAAAADGGAGADVPQLLERLAALEERVAELESEVAAGRSRVRRRTSKPGS